MKAFKFIVISGLSGSGKTIALHTLEDIGYNCIDNLPIDLLPAYGEQLLDKGLGESAKLAVGIDARNAMESLTSLPEQLQQLDHRGLPSELIYLEASDDALLKRFSETRRRHPLSTPRMSLHDAINREKLLLLPIKDMADLRLDTSHTSVHQLRDMIRAKLGTEQIPGPSILVQSFGFKHQTPRDSDFVFDMRCLPNPHWVPKLRILTGLDQPVIDFLDNQPEVQQMKHQLFNFFDEWLSCFEKEGRSYLTISVGCTGGQHRSVYMAEALLRHFQEQGQNVLCRHHQLNE
jgi:UPF0042 nucleotide-binding protein